MRCVTGIVHDEGTREARDAGDADGRHEKSAREGERGGERRRHEADHLKRKRRH